MRYNLRYYRKPLISAFAGALVIWGAVTSRVSHASDSPLPKDEYPPLSLMEAFTGKAIPLTMKAQDISGDAWRQFNYQESGSKNSGLYLSMGQTVSQNGIVYLAAYAEIIEVQVQDEADHWVYQIDLSTPMKLSLLKLNTGGSLNDVTSITIRDLLAENAVVDHLRQDACVSSSDDNLKQIGHAVTAYVQDNDGKFPPRQNIAVLQRAIDNYTKSPYAPSTTLSNEELFTDTISGKPYTMGKVSVGSKVTIAGKMPSSQAAKTVLLYEPEPAPNATRGILFLDGHTQRIPEAVWQHLQNSR